MGSSLTSQQSTPFIQIDPTEHCQLLAQTEQYKVFQNHRGQQYQKYLVNKIVEENRLDKNKGSYPKKYLENRPSFEDNYQYRLTHRSKYFVELLYASPLSNTFSCNFNTKKGDYQVVTQRITHRLSDMYNLSFANAITILNISLRGFKNLYNFNGTLWIKDSMIGVNQNGEVRVWLNGNYALNVIEPLPVSLINLSHEQQQDLIVNNLIDMVSSKTYPSSQWKQLMKLRMEMMADSRVREVGNINVRNSHNISFQGNGNSGNVFINSNNTGNSKVSEYEEGNNRMTFDLALEMVDAVMIRFGLEEMRDNNKVNDLFNQGTNSQMVRENPENTLNSNNNNNITIIGENTHPKYSNPNHNTTNVNTSNIYPSRMNHIKSYTGIQNHLVNQQMNGKPMYSLNKATQHYHQHKSHTNTQYSSQKIIGQTIQTISTPTGNKQAQFINRASEMKEMRSFHNPFIDSKAQNINSVQKRQSEKINQIQKIPINPFNQVLKNQQSQQVIAQNTRPSQLINNSNMQVNGNMQISNNNSFKQIRDIRNSIMASTTHQTINTTHNNNNNTQNYPNHTNHSIIHRNIQPTHPHVRVSFKNNQSTNNLHNFPHNPSNIRQNSLIHIGHNNSNGNRSNSVQYSSLSQSPQPVVRFGNSLDKGKGGNYYYGGGGGGNVNRVSTAGSTIRVVNSSGMGNHLIQRRSNGGNFVNPPNVSYEYQQQQQQYSGTHVVRPSQTQIPSVINQSQNNINLSQQQFNNINSPISKINKNNQNKQTSGDNVKTNKKLQNKATISESIIVVERKRNDSGSNKSLQIVSQKMLLVFNKSEKNNNKKQQVKSLRQQNELNHLADQYTEVNQLQHLEPDEQQELPLILSLTPNKQQPQQHSNQSQQNLPNHQQINQQINPQALSPSQPHKSNNLIVLTSYNQHQPNQQIMQISIKHCPTPDSSFIDDDNYHQDYSDIPYDEEQDHVLMEKEYNLYGLQGQSNGYNIETGKFIFDVNSQKEQSLSNNREHEQYESYDRYNYQYHQQQQQGNNTLGNQHINQHQDQYGFMMNKNSNPTSQQNLTNMNSNSSSSNHLVINGSTQTGYNPINQNNNNISNSNNSNSSNNNNIGTKSNTSSQGMYKYELKDTVNLFSLNSINVQQNFNQLKGENLYSNNNNRNDSINNMTLQNRIRKSQSIQQKPKNPLQNSQANTIINKLNKWDSNKFQGIQLGKFNNNNNNNHNYITSNPYNMTNSQQLSSSSNELYHFNNGFRKDRQGYGSKVEKLFKKHQPLGQQQNYYAQSMAQQIKKEIVGDTNNANNNNYVQMVKNYSQQNRGYGFSDEQVNSDKPKQKIYMNSEYFSKYFNSINPQSTKNNQFNQQTDEISPSKRNPSVSPLINQKQTYLEKQNMQQILMNQNLTYKQLRNLLNSSSPSETIF